jgi:[ribosomal protein S5]-alanine N-acetyltransferase
MNVTAPPPIESARLRLRLVEAKDLPGLLNIHAIDDVNRFLPYSTWTGLDDARTWYEKAVARHLEGSALQWVIEQRSSEVVVGSCLLFRFDHDSQRAEIGYVLGQAHWGLGYMREALTEMLRHAFGPMGLRRVEAEVDPRNHASDRVLHRLGFTREGLLRQRWVSKGEVKDTHIYGLLQHEWLAQPAALAH